MPALTLDPTRCALVVIDMQADFCRPDGFFATAGHDVSPCADLATRLPALLERVRAVGMPVVFTMTVRDAPLPHRLRPSRHPAQTAGADAATLGNARYVRGAPGTRIVEELTPRDGDLVIEKERPSAFFRTALEDELRARGLDTLILTGVTTNCCVDTTARDASMRDFDVLVLSDMTAAFGAEHHLHDASLANLERFFGVVASADALPTALATGAPR